MTTLAWHATAERPAFELTWYDDDGSLVDLSEATFSLKIGHKGQTAELTKTSGITGAATAPNVTVLWSAGELDITPGTYTLQLTATVSSLDRVYETQVQILDVVD